MTQSVTTPTAAFGTPAVRVNLPAVPDWVVRRRTVSDLLDVGVSGLVTAVTAPTGSGKTLGVACWASNADLSGGVVWLNLAGANADPGLFWARLRSSLVEAGAPWLPTVPDIGCAEPLRTRILGDLGVALRASGPWVFVLDDYPTGAAGRLERDLETVLDLARRAVRLVVVSQSDPALPLHRHAAQGELTRVARTDLVMDSRDVTAVLRRHGVDATDATARMVEQHTLGWACGVRLAASSLRTAATQEAAMDEADDAIVDFLSREVLDRLPPDVRDLVVQTSVTEVVSPGLARAILGPASEAALDPSLLRSGFVEQLPGGSFRCHPLLRATARRQLSVERSDRATDALRHAASYFVDHGEVSMGIRLGVTGGDWAWVARAFVQSWAVPHMVLGTAGGVVDEAIRVAAVGEAEPVLLAAVALAHRNVQAAVVALMRAEGAEGELSPSVARRFSMTFVRLALARLVGDAESSNGLAADARHLLAQLPHSQADDELEPMLDAQVGALEVYGGELDRAARTLKRGAGGAGDSATGRAVRADCTGQLALIEAYRGNLRRAVHHAGSVLADETPKRAPGVVHAHLAMAWAHLDRSEMAPARQHLDRATQLTGTGLEPWLVVVTELLDARLLMSSGAPEAALQMLTPAVRAAELGRLSGWLVDLLVNACAEALLASGEPARVLALVSTRQTRTPVETGLRTASALHDMDDRAGSRSALAAVAAHLASAPLAVQVECWVVEAGLADDDGRSERARLLVDRALRTAAAESMRRPFVGAAGTWLRRFVDADSDLLRAHGSFLATLSPAARPYVSARLQSAYSDELLVETLTVREAEVLALLAQMCTTGEIAQELFLSVNTIKTYVRGILRKLCVNRRIDAVRRGRDLGLC